MSANATLILMLINVCFLIVITMFIFVTGIKAKHISAAYALIAFLCLMFCLGFIVHELMTR
jgi:uncharacterized membrane protein